MHPGCDYKGRKVVKEKKTNKPNISPEKLTRPNTWLEAKEWQAFIYDPEKKKWRTDLVNTLYDFFEDESKLEIDEFCFAYKLSRFTLYGWRDKYPDDIGRAVEEIKLNLASRRRLGALKRKYDKDMVMKDLHTYDPEWKDINKYWSDMKKIEDKEGDTYIVLPDAKVTGKVKPRE